MSENRTGKYFKYAIGEIILVVIGILIALQVNNWNIQRVERKSEINFLNNIKLDLQKDITKLKGHIEFRKEKINKVNNILNKISGEPIDDVQSLTLDVQFTIRENKFTPNNSTFKELSNSGNLNLISSEKIKKLLLELQEQYQENVFAIDHETFEYREYISKSLFNLVDLDKFNTVTLGIKTAAELNITEEHFNDLFRSKAYKNGLVIAVGISEAFIPFYQDIQDKSETIIELIDNNINNE